MFRLNNTAVLTNFGLNDQLDATPAPHPENPIIEIPDCDSEFGNDPLEIERCMCIHFWDEAIGQSINCPDYEPIYWYHPDYLGHTDFVTDRTGQPYQHFFYAPFGEALLSQHTGTGYYNTPYRFNAKELDSETGLIYYGARYYMPKESVWMSVDPLANEVPELTPYRFSFNNPVNITDPTGLLEGTDVTENEDGSYTVVDACKDGDNNIYLVNQNGTRTGQVIGKSLFDDEFVSPESGEAMIGYTLMNDKWEDVLGPIAKKAKGMDLIQIAKSSSPHEDFDVKNDFSNQAKRLGGYYSTSRTAGNFLAGYNAEGGSYFGFGIGYTTFQKMAGALHQQSFNTKSAIDIVLFGTSYGPAPYFGENYYQYRASRLGWKASRKDYLTRPGVSFYSIMNP